MSVKFIRNGETFDTGDCFRNLNLLAHAQLIELDIGSVCGGHAKCAGDRIVLATEMQVLVNPPTEAEKFHLKPEELAAGMRLACQCFPNEDNLELLAKPPTP